MNYSNHPVTKEFRQLLRRTETPTERILWKHLRGKQLDGYRFRQQHVFGPYILDFYCPSIRLYIELDGTVHDTEEAKQKDADRTAFLNQNRISVIRFRNEEVEANVENVISKIREFIKRIINPRAVVQTPTPSLGPTRRLHSPSEQELRGLLTERSFRPPTP